MSGFPFHLAVQSGLVATACVLAATALMVDGRKAPFACWAVGFLWIAAQV